MTEQDAARTEPFVVAERTGDVVWLTLNRPERLNAVHLAMRDDLRAACVAVLNAENSAPKAS